MRTLRLLTILLLLGSVAALAKTKTIRGYVSAINSPTQFQVDDIYISCEPTKTKILETKGATDLQHDYDSNLIYLGLEIEVSGELNDDHLSATRIEIFPKRVPGERVAGTALLERIPQLSIHDGKFDGTIVADGRKLRVDANSILLFRDRTLDAADSKPTPLASVDPVKPNVFITYAGKRANDGSIVVTRAIFSPNYVDEAEQKMREEKEFEMLPGFIKVKHVGDMAIVADEALQGRVNEIGLGLVPEFQKALPDSDPTKLRFHFYVVQAKHPWPLAGSNGTILIPAKLLARLQNEAQLAAILANGVASVVQKQEFRSKHRREAQMWIALASDAVLVPFPIIGAASAITNGVTQEKYASAYFEQSARLSLDYVLNAGWDIREAPTAMRLAYGRRHGEPGHDPPMTGFLLGEIRSNYADIDYTLLKKDDQPYSRLALAAVAKK